MTSTYLTMYAAALVMLACPAVLLAASSPPAGRHRNPEPRLSWPALRVRLAVAAASAARLLFERPNWSYTVSRIIKRVPLDFDHPMSEAWPGFLRECQNDDCDGCTECASQEPPAGDGWQIWETVSEGSPISPVFADKEGLARWLVADEDHDCCIEAARAFIEDGYAPSMIGGAFGIHFGYQVAAGLAMHLEYLERKAGNEVHRCGTRVQHLSAGIVGAIEHIIPKKCVGGTDDRYYLVKWDRGLPSLLGPGDDPGRPMVSACRFDGFELVEGAK